MKILITGGSGFIGTHLINSLLKDETIKEIINLDLQESPINDERFKDFRCDIRSEQSLVKVPLSMDFDACIHLAALCKEPGFEWEEYFQTNHVGTLNLISLCEQLNVKQMIFTSTMMVYKAGEVRRVESSVTAPDTAYGISKLLAEKELHAWKMNDRNRVLKILRPAVVFGANENANFTRLYRSLNKGFFPYVGKSNTIKSSIYVKEVVSFIQYQLNHSEGKDTYNLSFPSEHSIKEIVSLFKSVFNIRSFNPTLPYKPLLFVSYLFELLNTIGIKNSIHHRRIQKLYFSTNIFPQSAIDEGYKFNYTLESALEDWKNSNDPNL